jgi:hypothetical protein
MSDIDEAGTSHTLEIPVEVVRAGGSRRGVVAAITIGSVLAGSIGLSIVSSQPAPADPTVLAALPSASSGPEPSAEPSESPLPERLPEIRSVALAGAPGLTLLRREADELVMLAWHPDGSGLTEIARVPGAYDGIDRGRDELGSTSHDAAFALLRTSLSTAETQRALVRIVSRHEVVWERRGVSAVGQSLWANDANRVVVPLSDGTWLLVDLEGRRPAARSIELKGIGPPGPPPDLDFVTRPLAFSADGRWVYGEAPASVDPRNRTLFRAATSGGRAKRISGLPTKGPARAVNDLFDPATGRTVDPTGFPNGSISSLVVRNPDGSKAWEARFPVIVSTAWLGDGRLVVMHSNTFDSPRYLSLVAISGEGSVSLSLLDAGPLTDGAVFGVRKGYVLAGYFRESPAREMLLVLIDPGDGRAGTLLLSADDLDGMSLGGWLD